jgi:hypothetical protein
VNNNQQNHQDDDRIKITITVDRFIADEIESAIVKYIGSENYSDEDDEHIVRGLEKAAEVFGRAYRNNKRTGRKLD